jgi:hypothetical protein
VLEAGLEELAAGAGVLAVCAAISADPATNKVVIRVFIKVVLLKVPTTRSAGRLRFTLEGVHLAAAFTPMDVHPVLEVHEKTFLKPFV